MSQNGNTVVVLPGDKLLICMAEEPTAESCEQVRVELEGHFEGTVVGIIGGVRAVVVQRAEVDE